MGDILEFKPIEMDDDFFDEEGDEEVLSLKELAVKNSLKKKKSEEDRKIDNERLVKILGLKKNIGTPA